MSISPEQLSPEVTAGYGTVFEWVDPDDTNIVLLDMNELYKSWHLSNPQAGGKFGLVSNINLGTIQTETQWITQWSKPGAVQAAVQHPPVTMTFRLTVMGSNYNEVFEKVGRLQRMCRRGGIIKFHPQGATFPLFIEVYKSPVPALFDGSDLNLTKLTEFFLKNDGVEVTLWRHPYMRGGEASLGITTLSNNDNNRGVIVTNPGNMYSPCRLRIKPKQANSKLVEVKVGRRTAVAESKLPTIRNKVTIDLTTTHAGSGTTVDTGETAAVNGQALKTSFGIDRWRKRWEVKLDGGALGILEGRWRALVTMRVGGDSVADVNGEYADGSRYKVQLKWVEGNRPVEEPAEQDNPIIDVDGRDVHQFPYFEVDMGPVQLEKGRYVTLEGWAKREEGNDALWWDHVTLIPTDEDYCIARIPDSHSKVTFYGSELTFEEGTPVIKGDHVYLNGRWDTVAVPDQPEVLPAGHHHVTVNCELRNKDAENPTHERVRLGWLQVYENGTLLDQVPLRTKKGRVNVNRTKSIKFWANGSNNYEFRVRYTFNDADTGNGDVEGRIIVKKIEHAYQRVGSSADVLVLDAINRKAVLRAGDVDETAKLSLKGGYMWLDPGDNLLIFSFGDFLPNAYDDVVDTQELTKHESNRTCDVEVIVEPRFAG